MFWCLWWQKEQAELRKLEDEHARQGKLQKQQETRAMYDKSIKVKNAKLAREMQEELAFDMKVLQKLLEETRNEALEEAQRKVRISLSRSSMSKYIWRIKSTPLWTVIHKANIYRWIFIVEYTPYNVKFIMWNVKY